VYEKDGLNIAYSNDACMWGRGIYFAVNANYSCPNYSYKVPGTNTYEVFAAHVITGNAYDSGSKSSTAYRAPPLAPSGQPHDSI